MILKILPNGTTEIDLKDENISIARKIDILKRILNNEIIIEEKCQ